MWIPAEGTDKFPTPVAGFVGNGYAIVSMEIESNSTNLANVSQVFQYLNQNSFIFWNGLLQK